jgi:pyrroloquinoline quinone biosynthesis protein A
LSAALHALRKTTAQRHGIRRPLNAQGGSMKWETPSFTDMRFGFEITMYIATR